MTKMTCPVCNTTWFDESVSSSKRMNDLKEDKKVAAPCAHGFAFLVRQYDLNKNIWYYEQIDFVKTQNSNEFLGP